MGSIRGMGELLEAVAATSSIEEGLQAVTDFVVRSTSCRNALLAVVNDEQGSLVITAGAGQEWNGELQGEQMLVLGQSEGIVSQVAATGEPIVATDVSREPRYLKLFATTVSEYAVPIKDKSGRTRGVLNLESDNPNSFDQADIDWVQASAWVASWLLDRRELLAREEALVQVGNALDTALTEEELIDRVIAVAGDVLRFQSFSVFLLDRVTERLVLRGSAGSLKDQVGKVSYEVGEGLTGYVAETGQPILIRHPQDHPKWLGRYLELPKNEIASYLATPVLWRGSCLGVLRAVRRTSENGFFDNRFTENDLRVIQSIAEQLATGLENVRNWERVIRSERMAAWGELSARSSHMIGNRVFALKGDVNELQHLIQEPNLDRGSLTELQTSLATNIVRIEEILQDFRDFVTATQINRQPTDIGALIRETVDEVLPSRTKQDISVDIAAGLPPAMVDGRKLRRAVCELLENATFHSPDGEITVSVSEVSTNEAGGSGGRPFLRVEVRDSGPGVPSELKTTIFQPFHTSRPRGMGLGLPIVKGIIDAHGGSIVEEGQEGQGAVFVMLVPSVARQNN